MRTNDVADRTLYAFRTWPVTPCARCKRDSIVSPDLHFCAVGVQCRDGCGQLVSLRGDGQVIAWSTGMSHACPPKRVAAPAWPRWEAPPRALPPPDEDYWPEEPLELESPRESLDALLGLSQAEAG